MAKKLKPNMSLFLGLAVITVSRKKIKYLLEHIDSLNLAVMIFAFLVTTSLSE